MRARTVGAAVGAAVGAEAGAAVDDPYFSQPHGAAVGLIDAVDAFL